MNQIALFIEPKPRVKSGFKSVVIEDDALVERAFKYEMAWYDRALRKGDKNREIPTSSTIPIREGNRIVGNQTVCFSTHPDINKRNTIVRNYNRKVV